MPKVTDEKTGKIYFECWFCKDHPKLERKEYACFKCGNADKDALEDRKIIYGLKKKERNARQLKEFTQKFDKSLTEAAGSILSRLKKISTKELVQMMEDCGLGDDYRVVEMADNVKKKNDFQSWAYHRAIGLMKALAKLGKCHVGTSMKPGHPYIFYLDKKSEEEDLQNIITEYVENNS